MGCDSASAQVDPPALALDASAIRAQLTEQFQASGAKAMLATVRSGDQEIVTLALGESMTGVPANPESHVRIGGISQLYLGTLLMKLFEQGDLHPDDLVSQWLPGFLGADQVTLEMLITGQSGYKDYVYDQRFLDQSLADPFRHFSRDDLILFAVDGGELNFPPGSSQRYSHTDFAILAKVLEAATGRSMEQLHQELIFTPSGLSHTGYFKNALLPEPVLHVFSSERGLYEDATFWNPSWTGDSGPLYSTVTEVARWARVHGRGELLQPGSFSRLTAKPASATRDDLYFGYGFIVANGWFTQNPSFNGISGACGYLAEKDLSIVIFTTQGPDPASDREAFRLFKGLVETLTPDNPIPI